MKRGYPLVRMALLFTFLLGSLTLVVWRQGEALEVLRRLDAVRAERVLEEARRSSLRRRVEQLESRARVATAARDRLGMRLPTGAEIVILPMFEAGRAVVAGDTLRSSTALARHHAGDRRRGERDEG